MESNEAYGREGRLNALLATYIEARERGEQPDDAKWLREHAEFAEELRGFLSDWDDVGARVLQVPRPQTGPFESLNGPTPQSQLGDYRILRELGRGGMGIVYEAEQLSLRRRVALKVLPTWALLDGRRLQRFQNEARAAARLQHPHIVPVIAIGCEQGVHYFTMRLIEGCSLKAVIDDLCARPSLVETPPGERSATTAAATVDNRGADTVARSNSSIDLSAGNSRRFFRSVAQLGAVAAEALEHAHQCGVIHRDVKPANLLLENNGHLWIGDFGLASIQGADSLTETGDMLGTLRYMSPEQAVAERRHVDERADVYSLGMTLYELVAKRPAFIAQDRRALLQQLLNDPAPPPSNFNARVPAELDTILLTAIAKEADDRYVSAQAMADDLHNFLEGRPLNARLPSLPVRAKRWSQRHPAVVLSTVAGLLVALVTLSLSLAFIVSSMRQGRVASRSIVPWDGRALALDEGSSYAIDATRLSGEDAEHATSLRIDWGDGHQQLLPVTVVAKHEYVDGPAEFELQLEFLDSAETVLGTRTRQVKVRNVPPMLDIRSAEQAFVGQPTQIKLARPHDPGQDVIMRCTVDWEDGHAGVYQTPNTAIHTYNAAREATVRVFAEDEDGRHQVASVRLPVLASRPIEPPQVLSSEWHLKQSINFTSGMGAFLHPRDRKVYVVRCVRENLDKGTNSELLGLFRIDASGQAEKVYNRFFIGFAVPHPVTGDLFLNYSADGVIKRLSYETWEEVTWASNIRPGDIDCCGYAIAPADYHGQVTQPLHVLAADRGQNGPKEILGFSAEAPQTDRVRVHQDQGILMDPVDVAISRQDVFVADASGANDVTGRIFRLLPGGGLERLVPSGNIGRPCAVAVTADNRQLFLADMHGNRVLVMDLHTSEVREVLSGLAISRWKDEIFLIAGCLRLSADERTLVITDRGQDAIHILERR